MKRGFLLILILGLGLWMMAFNTNEFINEFTTQTSVYPNVFFEPKSFSYNVDFSEINNNGVHIDGAVVPHHLLAHELIEGVFHELYSQQPSTIILVGPNHFNKGEKILTTTLGWQTPFGIVKSNREIIEELTALGLVKVTEKVFDSEHSMGSLMPFIKYYLPDTKVVPIILHHDVSRQEAMNLGISIAEFLKDDKCIIIASVDFSHYLTRDEAQKRDRETIHALYSKNLGRIFSMGNEYLDSPASIGVLFSAMENLEVNEFKMLDNTNSGILLNNDIIETTSYVTLIFSKTNLE
ncbi:MAG: hypothetical protein APF76_11005 [Desulfitibacter sp. BRH_c19]|nr:MAG: hypothetical protein APF76_11005 [Desulfitibacter sp. BRH_c19]